MRISFQWIELRLTRIPPYLYLTGILVLGLFLRVYQLDYKSLWIDELYSIVPTNPNNDLAFIINYCKSDQPPLYFLLLHYWFKIFPYTPFFGRLLSVVIGVLGVFAMYFLGKEVKNKETGLYASALAGINYFQIYYSQECRFYSLLFLLTVVSFIFLMRSFKQRTILNYLLYSLSTIGLLYTQYFGIIIFFTQCVIFILYCIFYKPNSKFIFTGVLFAIVILSSFLPWLPTLINDTKIESYWIEKPKPYFTLVYYYLYWGRDVLTCFISFGISLVYVKYLVTKLRSKEKFLSEIFVGCLLVTWILLSFAIPYLRSVLSTPMLIPRYTIISLPAIFLTIALGFDLIKQNMLRFILFIIIGISVGLNLFVLNNHYEAIDKTQWREAANVVISKNQNQTKVYSNLQWWYNYYFYTTEPRIRVVGTFSTNEEAELQPFIDFIAGEREFWVLSAEGMNGLNSLQQQYVVENFSIKETHNFYGSSAILYGRESALK